MIKLKIRIAVEYEVLDSRDKYIDKEKELNGFLIKICCKNSRYTKRLLN